MSKTSVPGYVSKLGTRNEAIYFLHAGVLRDIHGLYENSNITFRRQSIHHFLIETVSKPITI